MVRFMELPSADRAFAPLGPSPDRRQNIAGAAPVKGLAVGFQDVWPSGGSARAKGPARRVRHVLRGRPKDVGTFDRRLVPFSDVIAPALRWHLSCFARDGDDGLVFTSPAGTPLRHSNFHPWAWLTALPRAGLSDIRVHDLRHTGNMLTADAGANLRELMDRMGHASTRAAMIYLHSTDERQRKLADAVGRQARSELRKAKQKASDGKASGTKVARGRKKAS